MQTPDLPSHYEEKILDHFKAEGAKESTLDFIARLMRHNMESIVGANRTGYYAIPGSDMVPHGTQRPMPLDLLVEHKIPQTGE